MNGDRALSALATATTLTRPLILAGILFLMVVSVFSFFDGSAASYDCDDVAREARRISETKGSRIVGPSGVSEASHRYGRAHSERRCIGGVAFADGSRGKLYMRAYEQGDEVALSYSDRGFKEAR